MCSRKAECIIRKKGNKGSSQGRERTEYKKTGILGIFGEIVLLESSIIISPKLSWRSLGNYYYYNIGKTKEDGCCRWWPTMEQIHPPLEDLLTLVLSYLRISADKSRVDIHLLIPKSGKKFPTQKNQILA